MTSVPEQTNTIKQSGMGNVKNIVNFADPKKASNEVQAIMSVIDYLSGEVEKQSEPLDIKKERDWNIKINQRFVKYRDQIDEEVTQLLPLYKDKYKSAWEYSGITEPRRDEIDVLLSIRSKQELQTTGNDPIKGIDNLVKWLCAEASLHMDDEQTYSEMAVRFFVYMEFQRCSVFPNGVAVDE